MNLFHVWIFLKSEGFLFAFHIHWIGGFKFGHDFQRFFDLAHFRAKEKESQCPLFKELFSYSNMKERNPHWISSVPVIIHIPMFGIRINTAEHSKCILTSCHVYN